MFSDYGSADQKQHLNLSLVAHEVIQSDMLAFAEGISLSHFINKVFEEYFEMAEASISLAVSRKKCQLEEKLELIKSKDKVKIIDELVKDYKKDILKGVHSYPSGIGKKIRLNNRNFKMLMEDECPEEKYYQRPGQYIKAVIEEYSRKPVFQREAIYFNKEITTIENAILGDNLLVITNQYGRKYEIKPYSVQLDNSNLYHYLVGISKPVHSSNDEERIVSFRISRIKDISPKSKNYRSGRLTRLQKEKIEEKIHAEGVQFLLREKEEILLKMTPEGQRMYNSQVHLRPSYLSIDDNGVYHFVCTSTQIEYYFLKFGENVEIIAPDSLRALFQQKYEKAIAVYNHRVMT